MHDITLKNISFSYGNQKALRDLSVAFTEVERFALLGPNGSGKSTLFKILSTYYRNFLGAYLYEGQKLDAKRLKVLRQGIGVCFQSPSLDPHLSSTENLSLQGQLYGMSKNQAIDRANVLLEEFDLKEKAHEFVKHLSGGMKRKVEVCKALMPNIHTLILDEPTTGLDPTARNDFWNFLDQLFEKKIRIIFTTHLLDEIASVDRICFLKEGRVHFLGSQSELRSRLPNRLVVIKPYEGLDKMVQQLKHSLGLQPFIQDGQIWIEQTKDSEDLPGKIIRAFSKQIKEITIKEPKLAEAYQLLNRESEEGR